MLNQRLLLRIVLISLGIAAVVGAAGVLLARTPVVYRIDGSLLLTAVCCGLLMATGRFKDSPAGRRATVLAITLITLEFLLSMSLIWDIANFDSGRWGEQVLGTIGCLAGAGIPAVAMLRLDGNPAARVAARFGLCLATTVFLVWMIGVWEPRGIWSDFKWFGYGNTVGGLGLAVVACLVGIAQDRWHWRWVGIVAATVACFVLCRLIHDDAYPAEPVTALIALAVVVAHANLALRCPLKANQRWLAYGTIAAVAVTGVFINLAVIQDSYNAADTAFDRLAASSGILASCGTLALLIMLRINRRAFLTMADGRTRLDLSHIEVLCPVCAKKLIARDGGSVACGTCGLTIHVRAEEPRCAACGYSLLMNKSDHCPECGAGVFTRAAVVAV